MSAPNPIDCTEMKGSKHQISVWKANSMVLYILCEWKTFVPILPTPPPTHDTHSYVFSDHRSFGITYQPREQKPERGGNSSQLQRIK